MTNNKIQLSGIFSEGYGVVPKALLKRQDISSNTKLILCYLLSYTGSGATAWPNIIDIANDLAISKRTVINCVKEAILNNYIHRDKLHLGRDKGSSNLYTLLFMEDFPRLKHIDKNKITSAKIARANNAGATIANASAMNDQKTLLQVQRENRNKDHVYNTIIKMNIEFPKCLMTDKVYESILNYYEDRIERKKRMSKRSLTLFLNKIKEFPDETSVINAIKKSIEAGWSSVYKQYSPPPFVPATPPPKKTYRDILEHFGFRGEELDVAVQIAEEEGKSIREVQLDACNYGIKIKKRIAK